MQLIIIGNSCNLQGDIFLEFGNVQGFE